MDVNTRLLKFNFHPSPIKSGRVGVGELKRRAESDSDARRLIV